MSEVLSTTPGPGDGAPSVLGAASVSVIENAVIPRVDSADRLLPLDGWRGISILCVLACHMLPVGPKAWRLNAAAGLLGMSIFFTLSGFLITSMLLRRLDVRAFFIRRGCRILPLVLAYMVFVLVVLRAGPQTILAHFLFIMNYWQPNGLTEINAHLWSICVEIHFYVFIGLLCLAVRRAAFWCLPVVCLGVTGIRIYTHTYDSIATHVRVDEILAGAWLALVYGGFLELGLRRVLAWRFAQPVLAALLLVSCHDAAGPLNYARPYFAAALVGSSLFQSNLLQRFLTTRLLAYIAAISYALYVIHPMTYHGWLGSGDTLVKYAKRPLSFLLAFGLAHLSTFYYEKFWIARGKEWSRDQRREVSTQSV